MTDPSRLEASYQFCRRVARASGSNFYPCFVLLRRPKRRAMDALYAFLRHTDDLSDSAEPVQVRREELACWRTDLDAALAAGEGGQKGSGGVFHVGDKESRRSGDSSADMEDDSRPLAGRALLPAVADTVRRYGIPAQYLHEVLDGVSADLDRSRYESLEGLVRYCQQVASAVGLACVHIWGLSGDQGLEPARKTGIAFQLTNILRDLKEDARRGRVYLPLEDLRACDYPPEDLAAGVTDQRFARLMSLEIGRARQFYHEGSELMRWLEPEGKRIFGMMVALYHGLLEEIARRPERVFAERVTLGRWQKLRVAARWLLLPPRRSALP